MPKRQPARERAQATVDAAAASAQPAAMTSGDQALLVRVSPERAKALEALAPGRSLDAIVADLIDDHLDRNRPQP